VRFGLQPLACGTSIDQGHAGGGRLRTMTDSTLDIDPRPASTTVRTRTELAAIMRRACVEMGASHYILLEPTVSRGPKAVRILTSNWLYDWIEDLGTEGMARILESGHAASAGSPPKQLLSASATFLAPVERRALRDNGHAELYCQRLIAAGGQVYAIFTSPTANTIDAVVLARCHMTVSYALEQFFAATRKGCADDPLSERERECLLWVSEGKTTDEVALILGVSSNTVNSYVAHAIQKFGAANRAMAIATAIRSGII
jgi:DNA-binding CsgD family transcriptional regulator